MTSPTAPLMTVDQLADIELSIAEDRAAARQRYIATGEVMPAMLAGDLVLMIAAASSLGRVVQVTLAELNQLRELGYVDHASRVTDAGAEQAAAALIVRGVAAGSR